MKLDKDCGDANHLALYDDDGHKVALIFDKEAFFDFLYNCYDFELGGLTNE
jgi:hypothetical protein